MLILPRLYAYKMTSKTIQIIPTNETKIRALRTFFPTYVNIQIESEFTSEMLALNNIFRKYLEISDSIPGVGGDKDEGSGQSKEEQQEQERLRQEAIREAEKERRMKYKKQEEEREEIRQTIRDKVRDTCSQYKRVMILLIIA